MVGRRRAGIAGLALAAAAIALGGCAASGPPPATEAELREVEFDHESWWWHQTFPDEPPPHVEVVREVPEHERAEVIVACIDDLELDLVDDRTAPYRASWICEHRFPSDVGGPTLLTRAQLDWYAGFVRDRYLPCLAREGYRPLGSLELAQFTVVSDDWPPGTPAWLPYAEAIVPRPNVTQVDALDRACPLPELIADLVARPPR